MTRPLRHFGKLRTEWTKMCHSKVRFTDEYVARARIAQLFDEGADIPRRLWVYKCENCKGHHFTSSSQKRGMSNSEPVTATNIYGDDARKQQA